MKLNRLACLLLTFSLSSCSYFPDKEKDYQLTTKIPLLVVPSDLNDHVKQRRINNQVEDSTHSQKKNTVKKVE